jgi:hypothetical protein
MGSVTLNAAQVNALASLSELHQSPAHLFQNSAGIISVEFTFPNRYILATNGRAIRDEVIPPMSDHRI